MIDCVGVWGWMCGVGCVGLGVWGWVRLGVWRFWRVALYLKFAALLLKSSSIVRCTIVSRITSMTSPWTTVSTRCVCVCARAYACWITMYVRVHAHFGLVPATNPRFDTDVHVHISTLYRTRGTSESAPAPLNPSPAQLASGPPGEGGHLHHRSLHRGPPIDLPSPVYINRC